MMMGIAAAAAAAVSQGLSMTTITIYYLRHQLAVVVMDHPIAPHMNIVRN
ncbi:CG14229 [Drosophila busckii]|uniref:CG14229 n=1 Tax=Drosophila busckii TaxID=30019 RepID=A0A0M4EZG1_DROBS|nr:CG14229 [Drosophila busckii]